MSEGVDGSTWVSPPSTCDATKIVQLECCHHHYCQQKFWLEPLHWVTLQIQWLDNLHRDTNCLLSGFRLDAQDTAASLEHCLMRHVICSSAVGITRTMSQILSSACSFFNVCFLEVLLAQGRETVPAPPAFFLGVLPASKLTIEKVVSQDTASRSRATGRFPFYLSRKGTR